MVLGTLPEASVRPLYTDSIPIQNYTDSSQCDKVKENSLSRNFSHVCEKRTEFKLDFRHIQQRFLKEYKPFIYLPVPAVLRKELFWRTDFLQGNTFASRCCPVVISAFCEPLVFPNLSVRLSFLPPALILYSSRHVFVRGLPLYFFFTMYQNCKTGHILSGFEFTLS